ncbi:MAG TPA: MotA/TolQ/ExbB proton channel family protein [Aquabacterium sp.]|uniref:MotA/TolQ/ExbB proton channel family protein n=1 Tax=Aquabacterium sp. TaxID=1872578 RepID=UPI002E34397B|nr:MotA/TolQ/ExbB proton channel family protein [Aquabacterium sp.]HEX5354691.1 MotA/TolQ/ExbB proton channel family protein [Aquabacterium sp.]
MGGLSQFWEQGDAIGHAVAIMLLLMSIGAWVVIIWKSWLLHRARRDLTQGAQAFWASADMSAARQTLQALDREGVLLPLVEAVSHPVAGGTLEAQALPEAQLTRRLRDSLHAVLARLQRGQVLLASVGAVSPFVGLFGTVWGIYHAMMGIAAEGSASLDKVAGPVGEALIMTAAGLAVAIPAVLAYNIFGKIVSACEADLEGFAHDLRETLLAHPGRGD